MQWPTMCTLFQSELQLIFNKSVEQSKNVQTMILTVLFQVTILDFQLEPIRLMCNFWATVFCMEKL